MQDPYVYSGTKVLKNKFNVTEQSELDSLVSSVTTKRLSELTANPVPGKLDFGHYQAIHHYLFQDLWDWAGDIRTVVLTKSDAFTDPAEINESAQEIFHSLTTTNKLKGIEKNTFCQRAAIICAALYRLHPFRAGNLLTQQVFMSEAAKRSI